MIQTNLTDKELISEYLSGNENALEGLIERHRDRVFTSIMMFVRDKYLAEDIFQDTYIKVIHTLRSGNYKEEGKFLPWVLRISYNLCVDNHRKRKRTPTITNNDGFDIFDILKFSDETVEEKITREETHDKIRKLLSQLPEEQKQVIILRNYNDLSFKEIADLTNVSINTALGRMRYALINLRKLIVEKQIQL